MKFCLLFIFCLQVTAFAVPWLGISFKKQVYSNRIELLVQGKHPEAEKALQNLAVGDIIKTVQGSVLKEDADLRSITKGKKAGDKIKMTILRNGKLKNITIELTERPDNASALTKSAIGSKAIPFKNYFYANAEKKLENPKLTVLDFFATWCGPCRQTMPILESLYREFNKQGLEVIGISSEEKTILENFQKQFVAKYPLYQDLTEEMWSRYKISSIPTLILLDSEGYILKIWKGTPSKRELHKYIQGNL